MEWDGEKPCASQPLPRLLHPAELLPAELHSAELLHEFGLQPQAPLYLFCLMLYIQFRENTIGFLEMMDSLHRSCLHVIHGQALVGKLVAGDIFDKLRRLFL